MKERIYSLDLLRIICCWFVIAIHSLMNYRTVNSNLVCEVLFVEAFLRCCVPVFFMMTGFFLFKQDKSFFSFAKKAGIRIVLPTIALLLFNLVFANWINGSKTILECISQLNVGWLWHRIVEMFLYWYRPFPDLHLWYIADLIKIYLFYPLLKYICKDQKEENIVRRVLLILCMGSTMTFPILEHFFGALTDRYVYSPLGVYGFIYVLLGYELSLLLEKRNKIIHPVLGAGMYIGGSLLTYFLTMWIDIGEDHVLDSQFFSCTTFNVLIASVGAMIFFLSFSMRKNRMLLILSNTTFAVYLLHYALMLKLQSCGVNNWLIERCGILLGCLIFAVLVFLLAMGLVIPCQLLIAKICVKYRNKKGITLHE